MERVAERLVATTDFFSIGLLARTLFAPFRQISAGGVRGPLGVQMRAFFDRLISRLIGAMVRTAMIFTGCVAVALQALCGGIIAVGWLFVPALPLVGVVLTVIGWLPW